MTIFPHSAPHWFPEVISHLAAVKYGLCIISGLAISTLLYGFMTTLGKLGMHAPQFLGMVQFHSCQLFQSTFQDNKPHPYMLATPTEHTDII